MTVEQKKSLRKILMLGGVLVVLVVVGIFYAFNGRYISTDNAYVKSDKVMVSPQVSGTIIEVKAQDNQAVKKGDALFTLDPASFQIAEEKAEANLAGIATQIEQMRATYHQKQEELKIAQQDADFNEVEFKREQSLVSGGAISKTQFDKTTHDRDVTKTKILQLQQEVAVILAQLQGDANIPVEQHPLYKEAAAELDNAKLNLARTVVTAPADGIIGTMPRVGAYAPAEVPVLGIVTSDNMWIEANFKETELTDVREGQKVSFTVDTYPGHDWTGVVDTISASTGSESSILPAENATGNWVKVVQRIAVRIRPVVQPNDPPLRVGMSTVISVDTAHYPHLPTALAERLLGADEKTTGTADNKPAAAIDAKKIEPSGG